MGRAPCCDEKVALKKGPWTPDEDQKLVAYIQEHGHGSWRNLPEKAGLARCGKSCRLRWTNYLRPDIKRGRFSHEEDQMIIQLHAILGNRWSAIASHLPRRTDNEIKNYWNTHLKKRLAQMGIDPVTHTTSPAGLALSPAWTPLVSTQLTHTTQWSCALAEAEARLSQSQSPRPSLLTELIQASASASASARAPTPHPSTFFMSSWKTKVEDTLRPTFGAVKLEPTRHALSSTPSLPSPNLAQIQKSLQDWNSVLGIDPTPSPSAMAKSNTELLVDMFTEMTTPPANNVMNFAGDEHPRVGLENHFSPTSILSGPDSESCSGDSDSCFEFLHQDGGAGTGGMSSSYHDFPPIDEGECHEHGVGEHSVSMSDIPESFWQAHGQDQAESLLEELKRIAEPSEGGDGGLELMMPDPLEFSHGGEFDPQF